MHKCTSVKTFLSQANPANNQLFLDSRKEPSSVCELLFIDLDHFLSLHEAIGTR